MVLSMDRFACLQNWVRSIFVKSCVFPVEEQVTKRHAHNYGKALQHFFVHGCFQILRIKKILAFFHHSQCLQQIDS